jgi:hypothetical protein
VVSNLYACVNSKLFLPSIMMKTNRTTRFAVLDVPAGMSPQCTSSQGKAAPKLLQPMEAVHDHNDAIEDHE